MKFGDKSYNLRIELDTKNCEATPAQIEAMEEDLDLIARETEAFPISDLYITIYRNPARRQTHTVRLSLVLSPGKTLSTSHNADGLMAAYERCIRKLERKLVNYKSVLGHEPEWSKYRAHTRHDIEPETLPNLKTLEDAVDRGDYAAFRREMFGFEESVRKRVGRWVQRYPEVDALVGETLMLSDVVEEVFLNAFDQFANRPDDLTLGGWLEELIDPSLKELLAHPDEEEEAISYARTLREMQTASQQGGQ